MIKYKDYYIVFEEIPEKVTLAVNITNCQNRCVGCHSPELRENIGTELTKEEVDKMIKENDGINCFLFMGEGNDKECLISLMQYMKDKYPSLKLALYSGREKVEGELLRYLDYVKVGPYIEMYGPLNKETTNQRLYKVEHEFVDTEYRITDITDMFWKKNRVRNF